MARSATAPMIVFMLWRHRRVTDLLLQRRIAGIYTICLSSARHHQCCLWMRRCRNGFPLAFPGSPLRWPQQHPWASFHPKHPQHHGPSHRWQGGPLYSRTHRRNKPASSIMTTWVAPNATKDHTRRANSVWQLEGGLQNGPHHLSQRPREAPHHPAPHTVSSPG